MISISFYLDFRLHCPFSYQLNGFTLLCSICYNADRWDLLSKYADRFVKAGVKLHRTAFDIGMEFAAKVGKQFDCFMDSGKYDSQPKALACCVGGASPLWTSEKLLGMNPTYIIACFQWHGLVPGQLPYLYDNPGGVVNL